jgi:hypothetical protein
MRISKLLVIVAALIVAVVALPSLSSAGSTKLTAKLKGNEEVPGPGDKNGKGDIVLRVNPKKNKVCFRLTFENIEPPMAGHIHKGVAGVKGPIKVTLFEDPVGLPGPTAEGCVRKLKARLLRRIKRSPQKFYVNLHNAEFPDGAIRGQLERA